MHVLSVLTLGSALFGAAAHGATTSARSTEPGVAALLTPESSRLIPGRYIVKMRKGADVSVASTTYDTVHTYTSEGFRGFAATLSDEELEAVRRDPDVSFFSPYFFPRPYPVMENENDKLTRRNRSNMLSRTMWSTSSSTSLRRVLPGACPGSRTVRMASPTMCTTAVRVKAPVW